MNTYSLNIAYNGADFCGFARQPEQLTIQGEIEHALELIFRMPVETVCAGRTDSGVHARHQVVSFDLPSGPQLTTSLGPDNSKGANLDPASNIDAIRSIDPARNINPFSCIDPASAQFQDQRAKESINAKDSRNSRKDKTETCGSEINCSMETRPETIDGRSFQSVLKSLNALTADGIVVRDIQLREPGFSARFDAKMREYRYFIYNHEFPPIFTDAFSWHVKKPLDVEAMERGAEFLIGEHDFKSFCMAASAEGKRTFRYIDEISFHRCEEFGEGLIYVKVLGNAFLHSMVRAIVGTLVAVGKGLREPEWIREVLAAKRRSAAGENAPAKGLVLWDVRY